jgi:hypothetical protein
VITKVNIEKKKLKIEKVIIERFIEYLLFIFLLVTTLSMEKRMIRISLDIIIRNISLMELTVKD